jgi:hypothetical protein
MIITDPFQPKIPAAKSINSSLFRRSSSKESLGIYEVMKSWKPTRNQWLMANRR